MPNPIPWMDDAPRSKASSSRPDRILPMQAFRSRHEKLVTTEAIGGAVSVIMRWHEGGEGGAGFTAEKAMQMSRKFATNVPGEH